MSPTFRSNETRSIDSNRLVLENSREPAAICEQRASDKHESLSSSQDLADEGRLRLKIDMMILPTVSMLYLVCFLDRANIGNARIAGLEEDLGLKGSDYNVILSIFYISYVLFQLPSNILCKRLGPGWFLPGITTLFGFVSLGTAFVHNKAQVAGVRVALGAFEAGIFSGTAYYLSRWYRRDELALRLAIYASMVPLANAFGGLLASGILSLSHLGGLHGWRMIFTIEGVITCGVGLIGFLTLTDRPETARWLTGEEKELITARIRSDHIGHCEPLDRLDLTKVLRGIFSPITVVVSFIFFLHNITAGSLAFFFPTIIRSIYPDKSVVEQQLRTAPPHVLGVLFEVMFAYLSWRLDRRLVLLIASCPLLIVGFALLLGVENPQVRYGATFFITSGMNPAAPLCMTVVSANVVTDTARASALATHGMMGALGSLVATWSFLPFDAPYYRIGYGINLAASGIIMVTSPLLLFWMMTNNGKREGEDAGKELEGMNEREIEDLDWKHPGFRWHS
ncbi:hypothetical protein V5O48_014074 [Marasmius crinis-equi]|uniref:Major facilitator superfamily (MFS) profile domain-containing protein n=1 Tax=Marasmius crinis-equi TaxID=585013 RepID=A0ABR3EYB2_9AGAR